MTLLDRQALRLAGACAREHQELGRGDGAGAEDDLAFRPDGACAGTGPSKARTTSRQRESIFSCQPLSVSWSAALSRIVMAFARSRASGET